MPIRRRSMSSISSRESLPMLRDVSTSPQTRADRRPRRRARRSSCGAGRTEIGAPPGAMDAWRNFDVEGEIARALPLSDRRSATTRLPPARPSFFSAGPGASATSSIFSSASFSAAAWCSTGALVPGAPATPPRSARCRSWRRAMAASRRSSSRAPRSINLSGDWRRRDLTPRRFGVTPERLGRIRRRRSTDGSKMRRRRSPTQRCRRSRSSTSRRWSSTARCLRRCATV